MGMIGWLMIATGAVLLLALMRAHAVRSLLLSAIGGIASLYAVSTVSASGAALLACNAFTVCFAAVLGIPGVIGLLLLRMIASV